MSSTSVKKSSTTTFESWFIPTDILMIICNMLTIILCTLFLFVLIVDKRCHTVPMMLVANSCLTAFVFVSDLLGVSIFTLENDLKQIQFEDFFCIFRAYMGSVSCTLFNFSFLLQSVYRYIIVVYPNRLFCQSARFQCLLICLTWIFSFMYFTALIFMGEIVYNADNQLCQVPLGLSFSTIYLVCGAYLIPILLTIFIYFKLVRYIKEMGKRVTPANTLLRAQRELKMVRRTVILITILLTLGFPYTIFMFMSFFNSEPKYHFRIAYIFADASLAFVMIALFQFNEPLKMSMMKRIKARPNVVVATVE